MTTKVWRTLAPEIEDAIQDARADGRASAACMCGTLAATACGWTVYVYERHTPSKVLARLEIPAGSSDDVWSNTAHDFSSATRTLTPKPTLVICLFRPSDAHSELALAVLTPSGLLRIYSSIDCATAEPDFVECDTGLTDCARMSSWQCEPDRVILLAASVSALSGGIGVKYRDGRLELTVLRVGEARSLSGPHGSRRGLRSLFSGGLFGQGGGSDQTPAPQPVKNEEQGGVLHVASRLVSLLGVAPQYYLAVHAAGGLEKWSVDQSERITRLSVSNIAADTRRFLSSHVLDSMGMYEVLGACSLPPGHGHVDCITAVLVGFSATEQGRVHLYVVQVDTSSGESPKISQADFVGIVEPQWRAENVSEQAQAVAFVVSQQFAYVVLGREMKILWVSVTPGVPSEDQVRGSTSFQVSYSAGLLQGAYVLGWGDASAKGALYQGGLEMAPLVLFLNGAVLNFGCGLFPPVERPIGISIRSAVAMIYLQYSATLIRPARHSLASVWTDHNFQKELGTAVEDLSHLISDCGSDVLRSTCRYVHTASGGAIDTFASAPERATPHTAETSAFSLLGHQQQVVLVTSEMISVAVKHFSVLLQMLHDRRLLEGIGSSSSSESAPVLWYVLDTRGKSVLMSCFGELCAVRSLRKLTEMWNSKRAGAKAPDAALVFEALDALEQRSARGVSVYAHPAGVYEFVECVVEGLRDRMLPAGARIGANERGALTQSYSSTADAVRVVLEGFVQSWHEASIPSQAISELVPSYRACSNEFLHTCCEVLCFATSIVGDVEYESNSGESDTKSTYLTLAAATSHLCKSILRLAQMLAEGPEKSEIQGRCIKVLLSLGLAEQALECTFEFHIQEFVMPLCVPKSLRSKERDFGLHASSGFQHDAPARLQCEKLLIRAAETFGERAFWPFAFQWLEVNGYFHLLLDRTSEPQLEALTRYFSQPEREMKSKVGWVHDLRMQRYDQAAAGALHVVRRLWVPGQQGSFSNAKTILSVAKLAMAYHMLGTGPSAPESQAESLVEEVEQRLYLIHAQDMLGASMNAPDALMSVASLVHEYIRTAPLATEALAKRVLIAFEIVSRSAWITSEAERRRLNSFVWGACVQREMHLWSSIMQRRDRTDVCAAQLLEQTAFFIVCFENGLTHPELDSLIAAGVFHFDGGDASTGEHLRSEISASDVARDALHSLLISCLSVVEAVKNGERDMSDDGQHVE
ncbi:hypothetical protein FVE85_1263 [Porphyridium purpureum]|uniref:Uncharacterized protein n=1 Tax=Porphyridium purpureum TaxID=35688 RepID=A0A5J4YH27_PORPP|nr:hypothetical protein FVE85_1263 [Porphyridium purpureum]|eukprot:POR8801..scf251_18